MYLEVGELDCGMIFPGFPITMLLSGTSKLMKAPGAISILLPTLTPPIMMELAFMQTLSPMVGAPFFFPCAFPIKQPWLMLKFFPILAIGLITICPKCTILNPLSMEVPIGI